MKKNGTVNHVKIRRAINNLVTDGSQDNVNELANLLIERDAEPKFLQDLFARLSGENNMTFRKFRK